MVATALPHADESLPSILKYETGDVMVLGMRDHCCLSKRREVSTRLDSWGWMEGAMGREEEKCAYLRA